MRIGAVAAVAITLGSAPVEAAEFRRSDFGKLPDGRAVPAVTLTNGNGVEATIIAYGAGLQALILPDRQGRRADVTLGYPTIDGYVKEPQYFGSTVGRFANRIARGRFTLDGKTYQTPVNNGPNALHGGTTGFDKVLWEVVETRRGDPASVTLGYVSPAGDQGYPGTLTTTATYSLDEANALTIEYRATTDAPTIVNLTNHAYWNLGGEGAARGAMGHVLTIPADAFTPVDADLIPTGEIQSVEGTPFDFRAPHAVGDRVRDASSEQIAHGRGYDHNFVIARDVTAEPRLHARVEDPASGRGFELLSNQPGLQFYSGNFLDGSTRGKANRFYRQGDAIVLEPQLFPDTPNQPSFGSARLAPGQTYRHVIVYRFFTGAQDEPRRGAQP